MRKEPIWTQGPYLPYEREVSCRTPGSYEAVILPSLSSSRAFALFCKIPRREVTEEVQAQPSLRCQQ